MARKSKQDLEGAAAPDPTAGTAAPGGATTKAKAPRKPLALTAGAEVDYFYMVGGPKIVACTGTVLKVHDSEDKEAPALDLEVTFPKAKAAITVHGVRRGINAPQTDTWRPKD